MAVKRPKKSKEDIQKFKRKHRIEIVLNDFEMQAFANYCKKYKVDNKAKFIREAVMTTVLKKFDEDYPTLFEMPGQLKLDF
ncbi:MAG: hypothetical protein IKQ70_13815 [Bacteroidales bacterium]|nr:hypothetical protein [Bacteroidales bacterium]